MQYGMFYMHRCEQSGGQGSQTLWGFSNTLSYPPDCSHRCT